MKDFPFVSWSVIPPSSSGLQLHSRRTSEDSLQRSALTTRGAVLTYSLSSADLCFDTNFKVSWFYFMLAWKGIHKDAEHRSLTKVKASLQDDRRSTGSLSALRSDGTCPWNPVWSISFVSSIQHDQPFPDALSSVLLMEMKHTSFHVSSHWHHPYGCSVSSQMDSCLCLKVRFMHLIQICSFRSESDLWL